METEVFQKLYKALNSEQRKAVDAIEGPVMVIAGPGTGKTSILTLRIANILQKTDTSPDSILALTFTESGVHSMRQKLVGIIGAAAYRVNIFTFHGFANSIIEQYPEYVPRIIGGALAPEVEQFKILETIFESNSFSTIKPFGNIFYYVRPALGAIRSLKRENVNPKEFLKAIKAEEKTLMGSDDLYHEKGKYKGEMKGVYKTALKKIEKNKELVTVYELYEKALATARLFDYEDMIVETIAALRKNNDLLLMLQEEYQYVLADEHQDANNAQNAILELISGFHENPNLFIVGDEKQAIYRFQGASLENFLYFKRKFPEATLITLTSNYRSTQTILDAAHTLIANNSEDENAPRVPLVASKKMEQGENVLPFTVFEFENGDEETKFLSEDIASRIKSGTEPRSIAVLFRDNADAIPLIRSFERSSIPFAIYSDDDILRDAEIAKLMILLRAVNSFGDDELAAKVLFIDVFGLSPLDAFRILSYRTKHKKNLFDILRSRDELADACVTDIAKAKDFYDHLMHFAKIAKNKPLLTSIETIIRESLFIPHLLSLPDSLSAIEKLDTLMNAVKSMVETRKDARLSDFINHIDTLEVHGAKLARSKRQTFENRISLMTAHRSKGLEFDIVYITGVTDGKWGNKRSVEHFTLPIQGKTALSSEDDEDERRLFFVAVTRARKEVIGTYSKSDASGKQKIRSQFLEEIVSHLHHKSYQFEEAPHTILTEPVPHGPDIKSVEYLQKLFLEQGLNVSALNNYLVCPWQYFFQNLIRIPHAPEKHQMYGIAVHAALKEELERTKKGEKPEKERFLEAFRRNLKRQPLSKDEYDESKAKGEKSLDGYFDEHSEEWSGESIPELSIAGVHLTMPNNEILLLRGQIDRLDIFGSSVRVVDYKTGGIKSRNDILGETKTSQGAIKRQLNFYRMLLDLYEDGRYRMTEGKIDFIEPTKDGLYKSELFEITDADRVEVEALVLEKAMEIYTVSFWNKTCEDPKCEFCSLRKAMGERPEA
jgi:DNA helicase-2/ATP-dependent DNA helicase PcrA